MSKMILDPILMSYEPPPSGCFASGEERSVSRTRMSLPSTGTPSTPIAHILAEAVVFL